jgi:hypothetical protein
MAAVKETTATTSSTSTTTPTSPSTPTPLSFAAVVAGTSSKKEEIPAVKDLYTIFVQPPFKGWTTKNKVDVACALKKRIPIVQAAFLNNKALFAVAGKEAAIKATSSNLFVNNEELKITSSAYSPSPSKTRVIADRIKVVSLPLGYTEEGVKKAIEEQMNATVRHIVACTLLDDKKKDTGIRLSEVVAFLEPNSIPKEKLIVMDKTVTVLDPRLPKPSPAKPAEKSANSAIPTEASVSEASKQDSSNVASPKDINVSSSSSSNVGKPEVNKNKKKKRSKTVKKNKESASAKKVSEQELSSKQATSSPVQTPAASPVKEQEQVQPASLVSEEAGSSTLSPKSTNSFFSAAKQVLSSMSPSKKERSSPWLSGCHP